MIRSPLHRVSRSVHAINANMNIKINTKITVATAAIIAAITLAACGDSGSDSEATATSTSAATPTSEHATSSATTSQAPSTESEQPAAEPGRTLLTGTVRSIGVEEALAGYPPYEGIDWEQTFTIFELDEPTTVRGVIAGDPHHEETVSRFSFDGGDWEPYIGQHVTLSVPEEGFMFQSGMDLPVMPQVTDAQVVETPTP